MTASNLWYGYVTTANSKTIRIEDGWLSGTYKGNFSYDNYGNVYGTLDSYKFQYGGTTIYNISDINRNAYTFNNYLDSGESKALYAYVLSGTDRLTGSYESDRLLGFSGNDVIRGRGGNDRLEGGSGHDRLHGDAGADVLKGGSGNDTIRGGAGADLLKGGSGNDILRGGSGADLLRGGSGNDTIRGGMGKDVLFGNDGADTFEFRSIKEAGKGSRRDEIRDFQEGRDNIDLSGVDAQASRAGDQAFKFIGGKAFTGAEGQLRYEDGVVSGDVVGDKIADFQLGITDFSSLYASDFVL